jgi:hypothetical protein
MFETITIGIKKTLAELFAVGWHIGFTSGRDKYPTATYHCAFCHHVTPFVANHRGFCGIAPKVQCCKDAIAFPTNDPQFAEHLHKKPIWDDSDPRERNTRFIDTWDV